jgi:rfaE bifunctional protein kinase chain/domain
MGQIATLEDVRKSVSGKGRISFITGKFNVVHTGHLRLFRFAREISDVLIVGLFEDGSVSDILLPQSERLEGVIAINSVDYALCLGANVEAVISMLKPDVVVKGKEYEFRHNPEQAELEKYGGVLRFASGDMRLSSATLLRSEFGSGKKIVSHATDFLSRRNIDNSRLASCVRKMGQIRSLVIGDLIVDKYVDCQPLGLSAEDPTVVVTPLTSETFVGGAGIVAAHAASLGAKTYFVSVRGQDVPGTWVSDKLPKLDVDARVFSDPSRPTTVKKRYRAHGKTLLRVNDLRDHQIDKKTQEDLFNECLDIVEDVDVIIFSDFGYGLFSAELVEKISMLGREKGIVMAADSQSSSQIGDLSQFRGLSLLTPTEKEARLAVRDRHAGLVNVAQRLQELVSAQNVIVTLASEGAFLHAPRGGQDSWDDDRIPALNGSPRDVAGAGDAFLVSSTLALAAGEDIWTAAYIGSMAAACQIDKVGNLPLKPDELLRELAN